MNIWSLPACQYNYIPTHVPATSVSIASGNPKGWTAEQIIDRIVGRKAFAAVPMQMLVDSSASGGGLTTCVRNAMINSLNEMYSSADENSLMRQIIKKRIAELEATPARTLTPSQMNTPFTVITCPHGGMDKIIFSSSDGNDVVYEKNEADYSGGLHEVTDILREAHRASIQFRFDIMNLLDFWNETRNTNRTQPPWQITNLYERNLNIQ